MDDQTKRDFVELFNQGFEEVVLPAIDSLEKEIKGEFKKVDKRLSGLETRMDTLETRVEQIDRKLDIFPDKVNDYGSRLTSIESIPVIAHQIKK